jgi:hypothetical protein
LAHPPADPSARSPIEADLACSTRQRLRFAECLRGVPCHSAGIGGTPFCPRAFFAAGIPNRCPRVAAHLADGHPCAELSSFHEMLPCPPVGRLTSYLPPHCPPNPRECQRGLRRMGRCRRTPSGVRHQRGGAAALLPPDGTASHALAAVAAYVLLGMFVIAARQPHPAAVNAGGGVLRARLVGYRGVADNFDTMSIRRERHRLRREPRLRLVSVRIHRQHSVEASATC